MLGGWDEFDDRVRQIDPDYAGISSYTVELPYALECARRVKKVSRRTRVVAGGIHATMFPADFLNTGNVDNVICGEADVEFANFVDDSQSYPKVFWAPTPDLDQLPIPDRELWPDIETRMSVDPWGLLNYKFPVPTAEMIAIRGCPFKCAFCCGPGEQQLFTKPAKDGERIPAIRGSGVDRVMDEIAYLRKRFGIKSITFHDDQFVIRPRWVDEFCDKMHERGFVKDGVEWLASCRADLICKNEALIEKMARAGLRIIIIGFESFSPRILKWFNKGTTVGQNFQAARICKKYGIKIWANYILGVPTPNGWNKDDDIMTVDGIRAIEPDHYSPAFFNAMPGSPLYKWCVDNDIIEYPDDKSQLGARDPAKARMKGVDYDYLRSILVTDSVFVRARAVPDVPEYFTSKEKLCWT